ncbi:MAG: hypothetical protein AB7O57_15955 [Hyphomicrobiaceae bacterium]
MSVHAVRPAPAVVRAPSLDRGPHRSFLADVVIEHGPRELLGRLFLRADTALREKGLLLSYCDFDHLIAVNKANADTWKPIIPLFDPEHSDIEGRNGHALIARNANGEVVCATACKFYDFNGTNLKDEVESLRFIYRDPEASRRPGERVLVSAPSAASMSGTAVYAGALWYRPDYRGKAIMPILSTLTRGLWFTRWRPERGFSFMSSDLIAANRHLVGHMPNIDWAVEMYDTPVVPGGVYNGALIWSTDSDNLAMIQQFVMGHSASRNTEVDRLIDNRPADQKRTVLL